MGKKSLCSLFGVAFLSIIVASLLFNFLAPPPASADKAIKLRFATRWPMGHPFVKHVFGAALAEMKKNSNGRLDYEIYASSALAKPTEVYDAVRTGKAHLGEFTSGYTPGRFPLTDVLSLPITYPDTKTGVKTSFGVFDRILYKDYPDTKVFTMWRTENFYMLGNKEVHTLEDLKGLKIRTSGGLIVKTAKNLGATPVTMGISDVYLSLNTGVIDGAVTGLLAIPPFKLHEVTKYIPGFCFGGTTDGIVMNKATWERIPSDLKPILTNAMRGAGQRYGISCDGGIPKAMGLLKSRGGKFYKLKPAETKRWNDALKPVADEWVADMKSKGLPGEKALSIYREECKKNGVAFPF
ncbi:MAG: TRAP transporter substrate-binding protein [Deltaproteobacteria bacterium]|nr:TRAP transporter substrate-binding protein [Deltaproteobacteria bacterium]